MRLNGAAIFSAALAIVASLTGFAPCFLTYSTQFGTVSFSGVEAGVPHASTAALTALGAALLLAAAGKSAQFPLQSWLGDAMAGPTPVSALIHAATMVTAGVYLITRSNFVFDASHTAQNMVIAVGAITLLFGALVGTAKDDIKKALAASTMSQIGYMILATGLGPVGYAFAIMHLLTHGFFKAGMFLGAGSVMHGMNDEVNMRRYGAIGKVMPITAVTFGLGYLAIIGVPPFAGFYSKDKIIETAFNIGGTKGVVVGGAALLGAAITAFYMTRVIVLTFTGTKHWDDEAHPHESPSLMWIPMVILAVGSVASGFLFNSGHALVKWLAPVVNAAGEEEGKAMLAPMTVSALALGVVAIGVAIAIVKYRTVPVEAPAGNILTKIVRRDLLQDDFNDRVLVRPGQTLTRFFVGMDNSFIDGIVRAVGGTIAVGSTNLRKIQNGYVRSYALIMVVGVLALLTTIWMVTL